MDSAGRKTILMYGNLVVIFSLCLLSFLVYNHKVSLAVVAILFYTFGFGISLGPIVWIYLSDILDEYGISLSVLTAWIFTIGVGYSF